jgi:hypothetical protein
MIEPVELRLCRVFVLIGGLFHVTLPGVCVSRQASHFSSSLWWYCLHSFYFEPAMTFGSGWTTISGSMPVFLAEWGGNRRLFFLRVIIDV